MPAFVPNYNNDIFVSYAHVDNNAPRGIEMGWVSHFVDTLDIVLAEQIGKSDLIKLWMDKRGKKTRLTSKIIEQVKHSATFLMVLSPGFLASNMCKKELDCFLKKLKDENGSPEQIFIVEKTSQRDQLPDALTENIPIEFWFTDEEDQIRTLGWPHPEETKYYLRVQDVVYSIIDVLKKLKGEPNDNGSS